MTVSHPDSSSGSPSFPPGSHGAHAALRHSLQLLTHFPRAGILGMPDLILLHILKSSLFGLSLKQTKPYSCINISKCSCFCFCIAQLGFLFVLYISSDILLCILFSLQPTPLHSFHIPPLFPLNCLFYMYECLPCMHAWYTRKLEDGTGFRLELEL